MYSAQQKSISLECTALLFEVRKQNSALLPTSTGRLIILPVNYQMALHHLQKFILHETRDTHGWLISIIQTKITRKRRSLTKDYCRTYVQHAEGEKMLGVLLNGMSPRADLDVLPQPGADGSDDRPLLLGAALLHDRNTFAWADRETDNNQS